ncbi:MAG: hypothetical protein IH998_17865 [Proteobacteria bacterium]|nr:hypothetical protein [Pseudomonadota bacterium]
MPFFNCGSLHDGRGLKFKLRDMPAATECIRAIEAPCIAYKIMAAGRIDPRMAFEYAFEHIKPHDVVNVGMHRGDRDDMVQQREVDRCPERPCYEDSGVGRGLFLGQCDTLTDYTIRSENRSYVRFTENHG